jgi:hypothetical protein
MIKIGISSLAAVVLSGSAFAGYQGTVGNFLDGGVGRSMGTFTGAQLAAMRGGSAGSGLMYSTNWNTDTNGATYTPGNIGTTPKTAGQGNWRYSPAGVTGTHPDNYTILAGRPAGSSSPNAQAFQMTGADSTSYQRNVEQNLASQWATRTAGDDTCWSAYEGYMGSTQSNSGNRNGGVLRSSTGAALVGMMSEFGTNYGGSADASTVQNAVYGYAYATINGVTENYRYLLSGQATGSNDISPISPLSNAGGWTKYLMNWNQTTGVVYWYYSVDGGANYYGYYVDGAGASQDVALWHWESHQATGITSANAIYGDLTVSTVPAPGAAVVLGITSLLVGRRRRA